MTFDLKRMLESKKALRSKLAGRPLAEKPDISIAGTQSTRKIEELCGTKCSSLA
ncbi:MAG: hypothetical protein M0R70_11950 [Nitrospirae bacterium]|nr:hypothetical protein [Nitrospirota bacterium]